MHYRTTMEVPNVFEFGLLEIYGDVAWHRLSSPSASAKCASSRSVMHVHSHRRLDCCWLRATCKLFVDWSVLQGAFPQQWRWKLEDAPSEKVAGAPTTAASSSRLIGFVGSMALLILFVACCAYLVWALFTCQSITASDDAGKFMLYGSALFAPYALNKLGGLLKLSK